MKKFNGFLYYINLTLIILTLGAYIAPYFHPRDSTILPLLGLAFPAFLVGNCLFILYWLFLKSKRIWSSVFILLLGCTHILNLVNINKPTGKAKNTQAITIASYNMQFSKPVLSNSAEHKSVSKQDFKKYISTLRHIDVLCLQEHGHYAEKIITNLLKLPYRHFSPNKYVAIYSKYPIVDTGTLHSFSTSIANACIWADIAINGKTVRVYSAHFEANRKNGVVPKLVVETAKEPPVDWSTALGLLYHYQQFSAKRADQAKRLQKEITKSPYPTILCGDINDTPQSHVYKVLIEKQQDTFREKGYGLGVTFGSSLKNKLALLRIDYIFTSPTFKILNHRTIPAPFSDHYLIHSKIQLP